MSNGRNYFEELDSTRGVGGSLRTGIVNVILENNVNTCIL